MNVMAQFDYDEGPKFDPRYWEALQRELARLTDAGLAVSRPQHCGPPDEKEFGFRVSKPRGAGGHSIPDTNVWMGFATADDRPSDAPLLWLSTDNGKWVVSLRECIPGPGPGDFENVHDRLGNAISDILDYYFGDPSRMQAKWRATGLG
jgi:hypothetical protein